MTIKKVLKNAKIATFAGGCFWCMVKPFQKYDGVLKMVSGYANGMTKNPSYEEVSTGSTGALEAVQVYYNPNIISYKELVEIFWKQIDPTDDHGQFADKGSQYQPAIVYQTNDEKSIAEKSKEALEKSGRFTKPIVTKILPLKSFYEAEEYHQDYATKNPIRYQLYSLASGRKKYLEKVWGKEE